ncbi:putative ribonuclease H-like domain-containing protein [Tanacetum coccineum]
MRPFGCSITILNTRDHLDALTKSMNYEPVVAGNQSNGSAGIKACYDAGKARMETIPGKDYLLLPFLTQDPSISSSSKDSPDAGFKPSEDEEKKDAKDPENKDKNNVTDENIVYGCDDDPNMRNLEEIVYSDDDEGVDAKADMTNLDTNIFVSPILTTRIHKDHPLEQIIRDIHLAPQTRRMTKNVTKHEVMQEELLQFKLQHVWTLIDLPHGKRAIGTKWMYRNKKDERGFIIRNKARLFLAYASFKDFVVYQMDVKSAFLYGKIEEEVYVCQPLGFEDPEFPNRVYKVEKALYGLHQAHSAWYETLSTYLLDNRFQRGQIDKSLFIKMVKGLQVTQKDDGIFISQDKCVDEILKKFGFSTVKTASTPMDTSNPLLKDAEAKDVVVHLYRSMIGSLMYLTASRPDIILISWKCKKQTIVANSTTKAEYVAASSCYGQMSSIGELTFFLGLQVTQKVDGIFISQDKYVDKILKKLGFSTVKTASTPMETSNPLLIDTEAEDVEIHNMRLSISWEEIDLMAMKAKRPTEISQSSGPIPLVTDETVIKEWEDRMERAATTASSLEAEQDSGNINRTQSMATLNESLPQGTGSGSGPRCQDTILGGAEAQIRFEAASKQSNDPPLSRVNTLGSGEDNMKLKELMEFCTKLSVRALDL